MAIEEGEALTENEREQLCLCRVCGEQMLSKRCFEHNEETSHNAFRPIFDEQELNGRVNDDKSA